MKTILISLLILSCISCADNDNRSYQTVTPITPIEDPSESDEIKECKSLRIVHNNHLFIVHDRAKTMVNIMKNLKRGEKLDDETIDEYIQYLNEHVIEVLEDMKLDE